MRTTLSISVSKSKHITSAQQHHTERWDDSFNHSNRMISPNKSKQNINLTHNTGTYRERFENLIDQKYNGRRKKDGTSSIRKDAVRMFQVSVNLGQYDDKWNRTVLDKDKMVEVLKNDIYPMLVEEFGGKDNILGAAIHMDESTPHLHLDVVPLTSDGKLSAKSFIDGPTDLSKKQTEWLEKAQEKRPDLNFERLEDQSLNGIEMEKLKKLTAQAKAEANEYLRKRNTALQEDIDAEWKILNEVDEKLNDKYEGLVSVENEQIKTAEELNKQSEYLNACASELDKRESALNVTADKLAEERTRERTEALDKRESALNVTAVTLAEERTRERTEALDKRESALNVTADKLAEERTRERTEALDKRESALNVTADKLAEERTRERTEALDKRESALNVTADKLAEERTRERTRALDVRESQLDETANKMADERTRERTRALDVRESQLDQEVETRVSKIKSAFVGALKQLPKIKDTLVAYMKKAREKDEEERKAREEQAERLAEITDTKTEQLAKAIESEDIEQVAKHTEHLEQINEVSTEIDESQFDMPAETLEDKIDDFDFDESQFDMSNQRQQTR